MSIRLFGPRVLLKFVPVKERIGRIFIPNAAGNIDTHRMGVIETLGEGLKGSFEVGDTVIFQVNDIMKWSQIYRRMKTGDDLLWMLEEELIGRVHGKEVKPDTLEILGNYVLIEPHVKQSSGAIILPNNAGLTPEFIKYTLVQKGQLVDLPIAKGQEIIVNHGRITPLMMQYQNRHGDTENREYGYTLKEWVCGCVNEDEAEPQAEQESNLAGVP